jgi:broad specificity phosphatase PhoE
MLCRLKTFISKVFELQKNTGNDIVVFSHGFEFRVMLMIIMGWNEELFESFGNLNNCEYRIITRINDTEYQLDKPLRKHGLPITRLQQNS